MDASLAPYHQQHQALLRLAATCEARLEPDQVRRHPDQCLASVRRLLEQTKAHLAMEHTILCPALLEAGDTDLLAAAGALEAGLAELTTKLREYGHHWTSAELIGRAPEAFIRTTRELFRALRGRIDAETTGLFPLVERA
jgi:hypothetical protein